VTNLKELSTGHPHFYDIATVNPDGTPIPLEHLIIGELCFSKKWSPIIKELQKQGL
jgi:hypothetical protein